MSEDRPTSDSPEPAAAESLEATESSGHEPREEAARAPAASAEPPKPDGEGPSINPEVAGDIDLSDGKTLSDFLEEDAEPAAPEPDYRAIPNAMKFVMPPPPGIARARSADEEKETGQDKAAGARPGMPRAEESASPRAPSPRPASAAAPSAGEGKLPKSPAAPKPPMARLPRRSPMPDLAEDEGSFKEMLDQSLEARTFEEGQTITGTIVVIRSDVAFLDVGGKSEVPIDIAELKDHEGDIEVEVGDTIEATIVSTEDGPKLSRKLARGAASAAQLGDAFRAGLPVEGRVEKAIKGGYEVRIAGQRAFCPISQIDIARTENPEVHVGRVYTLKIIEYQDGGKNLVVSRRALLQDEERAKAEETRKLIQVGAVLPGRVVSVREYGAFVDLGGTQGLLHVSEMGWARVSNPSEVVKPGDEITVKILRIDEQKGRISLGLKQLQSDPWGTAAEKFAVGQVHEGKIVRLQDFGAFVELEPGIEGLAHVSTFAPTGTPDGWKKAAPAGTVANFEVLTVDLERKRIGVAMLEEGATRAASRARGEGAPAPSPEHRPAPRSAPATIAAGSRVKGKIERHEKYGVFVYLAPGRTGLMPAAESGEPRGADLRKAFPIGSEVEVVVLETDPSGRRLRLSRRAMVEADEKDDARSYAEKRVSSEAFGSIGEKLRAALESHKK